MLGGVAVPSELGEDAHSDGDVLLHAIIDALGPQGRERGCRRGFLEEGLGGLVDFDVGRLRREHHRDQKLSSVRVV